MIKGLSNNYGLKLLKVSQWRYWRYDGFGLSHDFTRKMWSKAWVTILGMSSSRLVSIMPSLMVIGTAVVQIYWFQFDGHSSSGDMIFLICHVILTSTVSAWLVSFESSPLDSKFGGHISYGNGDIMDTLT